MKLQLGILAFCVLSTSCGKKSSSDDGDGSAASTSSTSPAGSNGAVLNAGALSLNGLPDLSGVVKTNTASLALAVVGDAPKMSEITTSNFDTIMFGGTLAQVNAASTVTVSQAQRGDIQRGESVCHNIGESANVFRELGGGTLCYFSKIPKLSTASITVNKEGDGITQSDYSNLFLAGATTRIVKINVKQKGESSDDKSFTAIIKVYGTDEYPQGYAVDFAQCKSGKTSEAEQFRIDATAGTFSSTSLNAFSESGRTGKYKRQVSASLTVSDGVLAWDLSKDRIIINEGTQKADWGSNVSKQKITIDAANFLTQLINSTGTFSNNGQTSTNSSKIWSKTAFVGDNAKAIRLPEMALAMENVNQFNSQSFTDKVAGAVEWNTSTYANTTSSDLNTQAHAFSFSSDALFATAAAEPTLDFSSFDCNATPSVEVTFDMTTAEAEVVANSCGDGDASNSLRNLGQICNSNDLQAARQKMWQHTQQ